MSTEESHQPATALRERLASGANVKFRQLTAETISMDRLDRLHRFLRAELRPVVRCGVLLVVITLVRLAVSNPLEAFGFLYVIPISMLAVELGVRGGLLAAAGAVLLTVFWAIVQDVSLGIIGYSTRVGTFVAIGVIVGLQAHERLKLYSDRERLIDELHSSAMRDQLTGLPNRRSWHEHVERELQRARRSKQPLRVAVIDLDGLKQTNDRFGHEQGDQLIQRAAHAWSDALRQSDFLARLGGDEFVLLLPDCTAVVAEELARRMIEVVPFEKTCSVGVATWDGNEASHELVHRADQAMYTAKAAGGGGIGIAGTSQGVTRAPFPVRGPVAV